MVQRFREPILEAAVAQFHRQDEVIALLPDARQAHQVGVADALHHLQGTQFHGENLRVEADELQRDAEAAGAVGVPDLAKGAGAELANQDVIRGIRHRSAAGLQRHGESPSTRTRLLQVYLTFQGRDGCRVLRRAVFWVVPQLGVARPEVLRRAWSLASTPRPSEYLRACHPCQSETLPFSA